MALLPPLLMKASKFAMRARPAQITVMQWPSMGVKRQPLQGSTLFALKLHPALTIHRRVQANTQGSCSWPTTSPACGLHRSFSSSSKARSVDGEQDLYKILGVDRQASSDEIKAAYRKQALKWHPDRHAEDKRKDAERNFSAASNAYEILSDPQKRHHYDLGGQQPDGHGGYPNSSYSPWGSPGGIHSQQEAMDAAQRIFNQAFGGQGFEQLFSHLLRHGGPRTLDVGMRVQVLNDHAGVIKATRASGIDSTNDSRRAASLGKQGQIVKVDPRDQSVKVNVEGVGAVWFGAGAVRPLGADSYGAPPGAFGRPGGFGNTNKQWMKQEMVTLPDGRRVIRITRMIQRPDGSFHEETSEMPMG